MAVQCPSLLLSDADGVKDAAPVQGGVSEPAELAHLREPVDWRTVLQQLDPPSEPARDRYCACQLHLVLLAVPRLGERDLPILCKPPETDHLPLEGTACWASEEPDRIWRLGGCYPVSLQLLYGEADGLVLVVLGQLQFVEIESYDG